MGRNYSLGLSESEKMKLYLALFCRYHCPNAGHVKLSRDLLASITTKLLFRGKDSHAVKKNLLVPSFMNKYYNTARLTRVYQVIEGERKFVMIDVDLINQANWEEEMTNDRTAREVHTIKAMLQNHTFPVTVEFERSTNLYEQEDVYEEEETESDLASSTSYSICNSLLLSELFSDVCFIADDGSKLYAHANILSVSSNYFRDLLEKVKSESNSTPSSSFPHLIETKLAGEVIAALLTFMYLGKIDPVCLRTYVVDLLRLSMTYALPSLQCICEAECNRMLSVTNFKGTLLLADSLDCGNLRNACFQFMKKHATELVFQSDFTSLKSDYPELWDAMANQSNGKKRKRDDIEGASSVDSMPLDSHSFGLSTTSA